MKKKLALRSLYLLKLLSRRDGQDLIEYVLLVSMIAFASVAGLQSLSASITTAFGNIGTRVNSSMPTGGGSNSCNGPVCGGGATGI